MRRHVPTWKTTGDAEESTLSTVDDKVRNNFWDIDTFLPLLTVSLSRPQWYSYLWTYRQEHFECPTWNECFIASDVIVSPVGMLDSFEQ